MATEQAWYKEEIVRLAFTAMLLGLIGLLILPKPVRALDKEMRATQIIDREVYGVTDKQVGEIDDMIIRRNGKVKELTMDVGGFLGIGEKLIAMPFNSFQIDSAGKMVVDETEELLKQRKEFNYYRQGLYPDYYYRPYAGGYPWMYRYYPRHGGPYYGGHFGPYGYTQDWTFYPWRFLASNVIDRRLFNQEGRDLGEINDLIVDKNGKVEQIIIWVEGPTDEDRHVAVPYKNLGFRDYGVVYNILWKNLKALPTYPYKD